MFTVNLALSDFLMMITHCPLVAFNAFANKFFMWGPLGCKLYGCLGGILYVSVVSARLGLRVCIGCVVFYMELVKPLYKQPRHPAYKWGYA